MFSCLFGWRHASKCKKLVRRLQCRLKLLKNKRSSIVRQLKDDVAQLIKIGYQEIAIDRAEQLFIDESVVAFYELLDQFCQFIVVNMPYIRCHKDCPNDINEAVSTLIFASARCGDLPELRKIRKLFLERYGDAFVVSALELHPGNLVNLQIIEKLSLKSVPEDSKHKLVAQIATDHCLQPEILAFEFASETDKEPKDLIKQRVIDTDDPMSCGNNKENATLKVDCLVPPTTIGVLPSGPNKNKEMMSASSGENSPQFDESKVVYLDDVEEVRSPPDSTVDAQDKRLFKFIASPKKTTKQTTEGGNLSCKKECSLEEPCYSEGFLENKQASLRRRHVSEPAVYNVFTYPVCKPSKRNMEEFESCDSDSSCSGDEDRPLPPYNRAMTMPPVWPRAERETEKIPRSNSCPSQYPTHVHPKLPDCDEIAAKFSALKKEYLQME